MSAAEKLKRLAAEIEDTRGFGTAWEEKETLAAALPQIVAVVEAAETAVEYDPDYSNVNDPNPVAAALAALDEQLQDLGSATEPEAPTPRSEILKNGCEQALLLLERHRFKDDSEAKVVRAVLRAALDEALS